MNKIILHRPASKSIKQSLNKNKNYCFLSLEIQKLNLIINEIMVLLYFSNLYLLP